MPGEIEYFWDDLLLFLQERRVVPVIGHELLTTQIDGRSVPIYSIIAERLATWLRIPLSELPDGYGLNDVACKHIKRGGRREDIYPRLRQICTSLEFEPPPALMQLASITSFDLFVTLTFDSLMARALDLVRFQGRPVTQTCAYSPASPEDLPSGRERLTAPVVYHLLGKVAAAPEYAATDEDLLEFLHSLQSVTRNPKLLLDELKSSHLLFIGCPFSDWLARFLIRLAKGRQLSAQRAEMEVLVGQQSVADRGLVLFLEHFSYNSRVIPIDAGTFIAELAARWNARAASPAPGGAPAPRPVAPMEMAQGSVFISYSRADLDATARLHAALESNGIDAWIDTQDVEAGDEYDSKIRRNINSCAVFIPVISRNTERLLESYFRREWHWALERAIGISPRVPFIVPVVLDDTSPKGSTVPERLTELHWTHLENGEITPEFATRVVNLVREYRARSRSPA